MNLIIDASNIYHRSYWRAKSTNNEASEFGSDIYLLQAFNFIRSLKSYSDMFKPAKIYCVWDREIDPSIPCYRNVIAPGIYKANRDEEKSKVVYEKFSIIEAFIESLGCFSVFPHSMEGDDVITFLTEQIDDKKIIISSDKDLLQLIDCDTGFYDVNKKLVIDMRNFEEIVGVSWARYLEFKCLTGDPADNIPRVATPAKVKKLLSGELIRDEDQVKQYELNYKLMCLREAFDHQPGERDKLKEQFDNLKSKASYSTFLKLCDRYRMQSIIDKKEDWQAAFFTRGSMMNIVQLLKRS